MLAVTERDRLLRLSAELDIELGYEETREQAATAVRGRGRAPRNRFAESLSEDDERLVGAVKSALGRLASGARRQGQVAELLPDAVEDTIDGAELVMRVEMLTGRAEDVPHLLPGFVFLVVLPSLGAAEALRLSQRTEELLGEAVTPGA